MRYLKHTIDNYKNKTALLFRDLGEYLVGIASKKTVSLDDLLEKKRKFVETMRYNNFHAKHAIRLKLYNDIKKFMRIETRLNMSTNQFFEHQLDILDRKMQMRNILIRGISKLFNFKNETSYRSMLEDCKTRSVRGFLEAIEPWLPKDEYGVVVPMEELHSDKLKCFINAESLVKDKAMAGVLIKKAISKNVFVILVGLGLHMFLFKFLYPSFLELAPYSLENGEYNWDELILIDKAYLVYFTFSEYFLHIVGFFVALKMGFTWSAKNWSKRKVSWREQFFDSFPPFSLNKVNGQYRIALLTHVYLSGQNRLEDVLIKIEESSTPYVAYQVKKIRRRTMNVSSEDAFNTFYMGEVGMLISELGSAVKISDVLNEKIESLAEAKDKLTESQMTLISNLIYPSIIISIVMGFIPVALIMYGMIVGSSLGV